MARKTHRPDDILWTVIAADIDAARSEKQDITLKHQKRKAVFVKFQ